MRLIWASLVAVWMGGLGCVSIPPEVPVSTTYTLSNTFYDGYYTPAVESFTDDAVTVSPTTWAIFHFGGLTWDHTLLSAASFSLYPITYGDSTYAVDVIVAKDGVPSGSLIAAATRVQVGTIQVSGGTGLGDAYITFDFKVASTATSGGGSFVWTPTGAYTATGTANSDAFGTVNAAWTKHERDPADNTLFLGRSVTLIIRPTGTAVTTEFYDVSGGGGPAKLIYTTTASNTGLVGTRYIRDWERGRASGVIECPKTGWDIAADEAVRDGHSGMMVAPEAWDPPEPRPRPLRPPTLNPRRRG